MSEDIYAKPDFTKKVRFQTGVKEDKNADVCVDIDNVRIYDNYWAEESTPQDKSQDNRTEDQQQSIYICHVYFCLPVICPTKDIVFTVDR